jgi:hypothetical protein
MTETQQRFLRAIAQRVPVEYVIELHLFPPIRQGGVETGMAVVAEDPRRPAPVPASAEPQAELSEATDVVVLAESEEISPALAQVAEVESDEVIELTEVIEVIDDDDHESPYARDDDDEDDEEYDGDEDGEDADEDGMDDDVDVDDADDDDVLTGSALASAARVASRFTIHTARYRLTLKGADRGKWEVDVVAEADAPLDALDAVVRGVQRRAGEGAEPDRLSTEAFRDALEAPLATLER